MELRKFTYNGKEREVIVFKETNKNGEDYLEGVDINSLQGEEFTANLREAVPHLTVRMNETTNKDYIADTRLPAENNADVFPDFEEMIVGYRCFKKCKIEE